MMVYMTNRLEEIKAILEQNPSDPFVRYALALEYKNLGMHEQAHQTFTELEKLHPEYVPAYLMHGNLLVQMKQKQQARQIFQMGILRSQTARNQHALGELNQALEQLSDID